MTNNSNLHIAKKIKYDEFYTRYEDIEKELSYYPVEQFYNKTILCPCDDYEWSNFTKYFINNFERLKLKKLICTCIALDKPSVFDIINGNYEENQLKGKLFIKTKDKEERKYLNSDGDFRSKECIEYLKQSDIVVTNPPFSLFREFIELLFKFDKKFLVIGNQNGITKKDIFPLLAKNLIWFGYNYGDMAFRVPDDSEPKDIRFWIDDKGVKWRSLGNVAWFTNLETDKRHIFLKLKTMKENGIEYQKYDNFNAIEVPYVENIPSDYKGIMGVPLTFLYKYNPEQFEIVGEAIHGTDNEFDLFKPIINGKENYVRILIRLKDDR